MDNYITWFENCNYDNKNLVGGKNSSLGELVRLSSSLNLNVVNGFAVTTHAYDTYINHNNLNKQILQILPNINIEDIDELELKSEQLKDLIKNGSLPEDLLLEIIKNYHLLCELYGTPELEVAVRSSAIAEDLPNASFAGQQDTFLNVKGIDDLLKYIVECFASLFNSRAISYRKTNNIGIEEVKISVGIQKMVRSDLGSAGVAFSLDTETGYNRAIIISSAFGLGEHVVSGSVKPDEFIVDKRSLLSDKFAIVGKKLGNKKDKIVYDKNGGVDMIDTDNNEYRSYSLSDEQISSLSKDILKLENSYSKLLDKDIGVDVEWALDGTDNKIYIIQVRSETIHSNNDNNILKKYVISKNKRDPIVSGVAVGEKISTGTVIIMDSIKDHEKAKGKENFILVTDMTTPVWEPIMKKASAIITNKGGRTCHAAIVARELGVNALVGTGDVTDVLETGQQVTVSCAEGETGYVYDGKVDFTIQEFEVTNDVKFPMKMMLNVGNPDNSFQAGVLPNDGVGLARLELLVGSYVGYHPMALYNYPNIENDVKLKNELENVLFNYNNDGKRYFVEKVSMGIAKIASAFYPNDVVVRLTDFKSNEYKCMKGGQHELDEENPMIGFRGASRYYDDDYVDAFALECEAIRFARDEMGMTNIVVMIPFCRTPEECVKVLNIMKDNKLERGVNGLRVYIMCEIPSNVIEYDQFAPLIDGISIGGNDLLQLTLGVDRDSQKITHLSNHTNTSYRRLIKMAVEGYKRHNVKVGFCGQQPSDSIEFAKFLMNTGVDSISVTADSLLKTRLRILE